MSKITVSIVAVILIGYFIFTSGIVYELKSKDVNAQVDVPYSIAMSAERTGLLGVFTRDDIICAKWLGTTKNILVLADYNGINLASDYIPGYERIAPYNIYIFKIKGNLRNKSEFLLFLTGWNIDNNKMVTGLRPAIRIYEPIPDLTDMKEVFRSGKSVVYYCPER